MYVIEPYQENIIKSITLLLILIFLISCDNNSRTISSHTVSEQQPPTEQGEVWSVKQMTEARIIQEEFKDRLLESTGDSPLMKRDAHPKHHGCVQAELQIDNKTLKPEHRVGLFSQNNKYKSMVRFSNGAPNHLKADIDRDVRGMSVKVFDVPYEHYLTMSGVESRQAIHDFVFMNSKEFFIKDPSHYGKFMESLKKGKGSVFSFAAVAILNPFDKFVSIIGKAFNMKVGNPLDINYHSATPYKLGPSSMKMKFVTCKKSKAPVSPANGSNFLSNKLRNYLDKEKTCFNFYVQVNNDTKKNNIEDSQLVWNEKKSPYIKVGTLQIPKQSKESILNRNVKCENVSFNPWRAPLENRPLGGINRVRLEVYIKQAKMRHGHNNITYPGPDFLDL
jgi:catalase